MYIILCRHNSNIDGMIPDLHMQINAIIGKELRQVTRLIDQ